MATKTPTGLGPAFLGMLGDLFLCSGEAGVFYLGTDGAELLIRVYEDGEYEVLVSVDEEEPD